MDGYSHFIAREVMTMTMTITNTMTTIITNTMTMTITKTMTTTITKTMRMTITVTVERAERLSKEWMDTAISSLER